MQFDGSKRQSTAPACVLAACSLMALNVSQQHPLVCVDLETCQPRPPPKAISGQERDKGRAVGHFLTDCMVGVLFAELKMAMNDR